MTSPMSRIATLLVAVAGVLSATAAIAQSPVYYSATPAVATTRASLMTRATPWSLQNGSYVAARAPERDAVLCQLVAKDVGQLSSFSVGGKTYDADALAKCNAHAKAAPIASVTAAR